MIRRTIIGMLNIIMILPVYAALTVNPINLPISNLEDGSYLLDFNSVSTEHSIKYCLDITVEQDFYYEIILDDGITWGRNINSTAIENAVLVNGEVKDSNIATFLVQASSEPMLSGTCLELNTELAVNVIPAILSTEFSITTTIKDPISGVDLSISETGNLIKLTMSCDNTTEIPQTECETLVALYNNTYGNKWTDSYNNDWNLTNTPCSWVGVSCIDGNVTAIERQNKNLTGFLPDLSNLTELQTLDLRANKLVGYIPSMNSLSKLQVLILSGGNQIIGRIPKLDSLVNLRWIDLANNQLTGNIPDLGNLISLRHMNLADNKLEDSIPTSLKNLNNLELLKLNNNKLSANIPDLNDLTKLQTIWLQNNQLEENVPSINNLINLADLDLGYNKLIADVTLQEFITSKYPDWADTQTIPPTDIIATAKSPTSVEIKWTPISYTADTGYYQINYSTTSGDYNLATNSKTDNSLTLSDLSPATNYYFTITTITESHDQQQNELSSISEEFTISTFNLPEIIVIDTDDNTITDDGNITFDDIILGNEFSKTFTVKNNANTSVNLSQLGVTGDNVFKVKENFNPVIITIGQNESATFTIGLDTADSGIFTGEVSFHFSHQDNPYNFIITAEVITNIVDETDCTAQTNVPEIECQTLLTLYEQTDGENWNNNINWNKTNNPCSWNGITCDDSYIVAIELTNNNLVGSIPDLSSLTNLQTLDLSFNQLNRDIPISLSNFTNLSNLNLDYNKLTVQDEPNLSVLLESLNPDWDATQTVPPNDVKITTVSPTTLSLQWTAITYQFATGSYSVKYATTSGGPYDNIKEITVVSNQPDYEQEIEDLLPDTNYYFIVETNTNSENHISNSEPSSEILATTLPNIFSTPEPNSLLDMGSSELATPSTAIDITILQSDIEITNISIIDNDDFTVNNNLNILTVQCTPSEIGIRESTLKIDYLVEGAIETAQYFLTCIGKAATESNYDSNPKPNSIIDIGTTKTGETITSTLTIFNYVGLEIIDYLLIGEQSSDFSLSKLVQDTNYELVISCNPTSNGERKTILRINTNDPVNNIIDYELNCIGNNPIYISNPAPNSTLIMSAIIATSTAGSIEISNTGNETLAITEIIVTNNDIFQVNDTPFLVENESHILEIQCVPMQEGKYLATLTLTTNLSEQINYGLECIGVPDNSGPIYNSIPKPTDTLRIGTAALNTDITKSIAISNQGDGTLTIESSVITGDTSFSIINGKAPFSIINPIIHNLEVQCIPEQAGQHTAVLTLAIKNKQPVSYNLECTGVNVQIAIYASKPEPNSIIKIGSTTVANPITTTINISEIGNETLNIISSDINSSTKEVFSIIEGIAPFSIADGGNNHILVVQCTPVEIASYTAQLILQTNDPTKNLVKYDLICNAIKRFSVTGEIRTQTGNRGNDISIDASENFSLIGWLKPSPQHIGQLVDIIANYHWKAFDNSSSFTIPVKVNSQVQLLEELEIKLFEGSVTNMAGLFEVEFGYQISENENFIGQIAKLKINPNNPPTVTELNIEVNNNLLGTFSTVDSDNSDRFIYSLINSNGYFRIIGNELYVTNLMPKFMDIKLIADESLDNIYPIEVQTTDASGAYITNRFIIQIVPIIEPPIFHLTNKSVLENYHGIVGRVWSDSDELEFKLLENDNFELDDNGILRTKQPLDFETNINHNITIQGTEEKIFTIDVINIPDITVYAKVFDNITDFIEITADKLDVVKIEFIPDITHRNQEADILAVATYKIDQKTNFIVLNNDTWQEWDRFTLPAFTHLMLEEKHEAELFSSTQFTAGELQVYIGYRLDNRELIYNPKPVTIEIK